MSANPLDEALQRLNYFNGQRLAAGDFRSEQGYHMGMRRVLNRSLYSPGIVVGLEVEPAKSNPPNAADKHRVIVKRGLAFDHLGREIFLPVDASVQVMGVPSSTPGIVFGNLLVVSYREERKFPAQSNCTIGAPYKPCSSDLPWGAPTRIVADAVFEFLDSSPSDDSGKIVLSQIELSKTCEVVRTSPGVRKYAVPAKQPTIRSLSLEGEKNIAQNNGKVLYFHVEGGQPESVTLYLRGRPFSDLFYTELGNHRHTLTVADLEFKLDHEHKIKGEPKTELNSGTHRHSFSIDDINNQGYFDMNKSGNPWDYSENNQNNPMHVSGGHEHELIGIEIEPVENETRKVKVVDNNSIGPTGADQAARTGVALTVLKDLIVKLDGKPIGREICAQLENKPGQFGKWKIEVSPTDIRLDGNSLNQPDGTGEIDLLKVGVEIGIGEHKIEFLVSDKDVGGTLQYNLYVS